MYSLVVFVYRLVLNPCTKTAKCYVKQNWRERTLKLRMSPYRLGKDFNIKKPRFSGITKHGCTQIIFYILTIQMVSVGPTKVYLNTHNIRLERIYIHSTLLIKCFMLTGESWGTPDKVVANYLLSLPIICFLWRFNPFSGIYLTLTAL